MEPDGEGADDEQGTVVGVSTSASIEPDPARRRTRVGAWRAPDYATVNLSETGAAEVMQALLEARIGIEAGVWSVEDAERLAATGLGEQVTRILIEPVAVSAANALALVEEIHLALDRLGFSAPRLQHGEGEASWVLLGDTVRRGIDTRFGLEDTVDEPSGERTSGNVGLVHAARRLGAGLELSGQRRAQRRAGQGPGSSATPWSGRGRAARPG